MFPGSQADFQGPQYRVVGSSNQQRIRGACFTRRHRHPVSGLSRKL